MKLSIIGSGYVGLTSGTCFAEVGHHVVCIDNDEQKVQALRRGEIPIYEPGLEELICKNMNAGRLSFTNSLKEGIAEAEAIFIAVPTPPLPNGGVDLSFMKAASIEIAEALEPGRPYCVIVDKSTVPVRTGQKVRDVILTHTKGAVDFDVVSNPEFLREGSAIHDLLNPDRIVIGADNQRAMNVIQKVYQTFKSPILQTDIQSAELIKHAANSFLALKISYINAVSKICEATGANIDLVAEGIGMDKRISEHFLRAGIGYGGSCFPKDIQAFIQISEQLGESFELLKEVEKINAGQITRFLSKIKKRIHFFRDKKIAVWGLAFKSNTDDIRESSSIKICKAIAEKGGNIFAYDPKANKNAAKELSQYPNVKILADKYECAKDADVLIIATEWEEFANANLRLLKANMKSPLIFDGRNLMNSENMKFLNFEYHSIGRQPIQ